MEQLQRKWTFYVWFINTCLKKKPPSHDEKFHGNRGWSKILEGNGVVFENFTINHGNGGGCQNKLFIPPKYS